MAAKSTLPLAALCCALALTCPQEAGAQMAGNGVATVTPLPSTAALPRPGARVSCTGCLSRSPSACAVVVDTARADGDGDGPKTGTATLRLPGFVLDDGGALDLELRLDVTASGLQDGEAVVDFADPGTGILLGSPRGGGNASLTVTARLLRAGTDLAAPTGRVLIAERIVTGHAGSTVECPAPPQTVTGKGDQPLTLAWTGGSVYRLSSGPSADGDASPGDKTRDTDDKSSGTDGAPIGDGATAPDAAGTEDRLAGADDRPQGGQDSAEDTGTEDDTVPDSTSGTASTAPVSGATDAGSAFPANAEDPLAVDADALDPDEDRFSALVALDAPQTFATADYPVTSAASRRALLLAFPKRFQVTYLPSGEIVVPTLLRIMGATSSGANVKGIRIENRATDAKVRLLARNPDGSLKEWFDGDTYLLGERQIKRNEDVDFEVRVEGLSHETDGELIEASVYQAQPLFDLVFEYTPVAPSS